MNIKLLAQTIFLLTLRSFFINSLIYLFFIFNSCKYNVIYWFLFNLVELVQ